MYSILVADIKKEKVQQLLKGNIFFFFSFHGRDNTLVYDDMQVEHGRIIRLSMIRHVATPPLGQGTASS